MAKQTIRLPSPRPKVEGATRYVGHATENGLEIYDGGTKSHLPLSTDRLISILAEAQACSVREFLLNRLSALSGLQSGATNGQNRTAS